NEELRNIIEKKNEVFVTLYKDKDLEKYDDDEETDGDDDDDAPDGDNDDKDDDETDGHNDDKDDDEKDENTDKNDDKTDEDEDDGDEKDNHDETNGDNDDIDEDDGDENIRNEKEKKNVDEGNKEEAGSENVKGDKVEQKDENVEEVKENKKVPDYRVWEKSKAIVPFVEVNVPGGSNAVDSQETLNCFFRNELEDFEPLTLSLENGKKYSNKRRKLPVFDDVSILNTQLESEKISDGKVYAKKIDDVPYLKEDAHDVPPVDARSSFNILKFKLNRDSDGKVYVKKIDDVPYSEDKRTVNVVEVLHQKVINFAKDKTVQVPKKEVPKKINAKVAVKRSPKAVDVPPDRVDNAAKKKLAAMTQFKHPRPAIKIIKDDYQTPKKGRKRVAQDLEEDLVLSGNRMVNPSFALVSPYFERKTMYTKPFTVAEKKIVDYIWSYNSPEGYELVPPHMVESKNEVMRKRRTVFKENIEYILKEAKKKIFNDVHLVFFPCIKLSEEEERRNHYYLICFNMMTAEIDIIDNIQNDLEDLDLRYGPYAMALLVLSIENKGKRLEVFIEEKGKEDKVDEDVPDIKKGRSTSTSISIESIADHTGVKKKFFGKKSVVEPHPISIDEYNDSESASKYTRIIKKTKVKRTTVEEESLASKRKNMGKTMTDVKKKNKKFDDVEESESNMDSTQKEKIKMVLTEKYLKKKGKLVAEDSKITKKDLRKKGKMVVPIDEDEELTDEDDREYFKSKKF
ncbi:hypothetical protein Tco_0902760, partial [Tanacetum coccineum]